jgi:hypothetical protein
MSIKIKELTLGKGITADADDMIRLAECKNLILENGALRKRGGIFAPLRLQDEAHKPKRINGIFGYGNEILVHAGQDLYACTRDLSIKKRLDVKLADEKTSGFVADSMLYIVGGGAKNQFLNHLTEQATNKKVVALPIEATTLGNLKMQMEAK